MVLQRPSVSPAANAETSNAPGTTTNNNNDEESDESSGSVPQTQHQPVPCNDHTLVISKLTNLVRAADYVEAVSYVQKVKEHFQDRTEVYNQFLYILEQVVEREITIREAARCVSDLFDGHNDLLIGFYSFVPPGYEISIDDTNKHSR